MTEILKTVEIDTEKDVYKINGEDVSKTCSKFSLSCVNGMKMSREFVKYKR